jgi:hypothetical protein
MSWGDFESGCSQNGRFERPLAPIVVSLRTALRSDLRRPLPKNITFWELRRLSKFFIDTGNAWKSRICCVPSSAISEEEESRLAVPNPTWRQGSYPRTPNARSTMQSMRPNFRVPDQTRKAISSDHYANQWRGMKTVAFLRSEFAVKTSSRGR